MIKEKILNVVSKLNEKKNTVVAAAVPVTAGALSVGAFAAESGGTTLEVPLIGDQISQAAFNGIFDQIVSILPAVLPVMVACIALRKGISFLQSMLFGL